MDKNPHSPTFGSPRISGVVVARNEANRIAFALEAVRPLVQEIIFFDMDSSDRTGEIAESYGATVFRVPPMGGQEPARVLAIEKATGDWILMFDADEILSSAMRERLFRLVRDDEADVASLPRLNYLFGKVMTGALMGANDDRQIRFFKRGCVDVSPLLHAQPTIHLGSRVLDLQYPNDGAIIHFNYVDISNYLEKFNRYTGMEAAKPASRKEYTFQKMVLKAGWEYVNRYLRKGGYRDGWRGLYIALAMSFYRFTIWARVRELEEVGTREDVEDFYRKEAKNSTGG